MSQQRTLVLSHTGQEGGAELALVRLVRRLRGRGDDVQVLLFAHGPLESRLAAHDVPTTVCPLAHNLAEASRFEAVEAKRMLSRLGTAAGFVVRLRRAIRASGADLVVANTLKAAVFATITAPLARRAWVWHLHDRLAGDYLPTPLVALTRAVALLGPRTIVANSRATLDTIPRRARRRTVVAYPGLEDEAFIDAAPDQPRVIGIVGRVSPTKGQREFLEAAGIVARTHPDVRFRVIGTALFGESRYETRVHELGDCAQLAGRVEFTGWASDVTTQIGRLSLLVHASPVPEPFGQVVVEAFAAGVPVIAARSGGIPEIMAAEESVLPPAGWLITARGVLVRPGDSHALAEAMAAVLDDPAAAHQRANRARAAAQERFAIEKTADAVSRAWSSARYVPPPQRTRRERATAN